MYSYACGFAGVARLAAFLSVTLVSFVSQFSYASGQISIEFLRSTDGLPAVGAGSWLQQQGAVIAGSGCRLGVDTRVEQLPSGLKAWVHGWGISLSGDGPLAVRETCMARIPVEFPASGVRVVKAHTGARAVRTGSPQAQATLQVVPLFFTEPLTPVTLQIPLENDSLGHAWGGEAEDNINKCYKGDKGFIGLNIAIAAQRENSGQTLVVPPAGAVVSLTFLVEPCL